MTDVIHLAQRGEKLLVIRLASLVRRALLQVRQRMGTKAQKGRRSYKWRRNMRKKATKRSFTFLLKRENIQRLFSSDCTVMHRA